MADRLPKKPRALSPEELRRGNRRKFAWHKLAQGDPAFRGHWLIPRLISLIMDEYDVRVGYVEFSDKGAARALDVDPRQIARAKKMLIERGWLKLVGAYDRRLKHWNANQYDLSGGPDDLLLDAHRGPDTDVG